jgi:FkbM family methyltransferase
MFIGEGILLCRVLGTYFIDADVYDLGVSPYFALNGFWETEVTLALARAVQPAFWCLGVGANQGYYTLVLAAGTRLEGHVTAVEPNPRSFDLMTRTLDVNGLLGNTDVVSRAISDRYGDTVEFFIPTHRGMNALVGQGGSPIGTTSEAETETIDHLTEEWPRVDVVKIDVEGSEEAGVARNAMRPHRKSRDHCHS